jgi:hypothetical protein
MSEIIYLVQARRVYTSGGDVIDTWLVRAESAQEARQKIAQYRQEFGHPPYFSMRVKRGLKPDTWGSIVQQKPSA